MNDEKTGVSRRDFFKRAIPKDTEKAVPETLNYDDPVILLRPPTALPESEFVSACTSCGECIKACPYDALSNVPEANDSAGTPYFVFTENPCRLCDDMPCVTACETSALDATREVRIGRAFLRVMDCLASATSMCTVCVERCPVDAIRLERNKPKIANSKCLGCGECVFRCPAPTRAIVVLP